MLPYQLIDLTHTLLPGQEQYTVELKQRGPPRTTPTGDIMHDLHLWSHSGTHVEVPLHFYAEGKDTSDFAPDTFVGPAIRLDFRHKQVDEAITPDDFKKAGDIRERDIVIMWQGRDHQYRTSKSLVRHYVSA